MSETDGQNDVAVAIPVLPPRPDAFITLLTSDDFLPGAQTLLYSVKKQLPKKIQYPPELVVLVTPNVKEETRTALQATFCTRVEDVEPLSFPSSGSLQAKQVVSAHVEGWGAQGTLTKLHVFAKEQYDTIVYLDADTLVVKDISHMLDLGKLYLQSEPLLAAAPDIFPPDKFNAGVLVIRPSKAVFDNMMQQTALLTTYDGGDTGFLNAYFPEWHTEMPPFARLSFGYNAQRFLYQCTYEKQPNYWDLAVAPDLYIIHYSSSPKPWERKPPPAAAATDKTPAITDQFMEEEQRNTLKRVNKTDELDALWWKWYQRSKNFEKAFLAKQEEKRRVEEEAAAAAVTASPKKKKKKKSNASHDRVSARYRELRTQGKNAKEAMKMAREEVGDVEDDSPSGTTSQVAAMFGLTGMM